MKTTTDLKEQAEQLHKKADIFIIGSVDEDGYPSMKAILPARHRESMETIYFCTNTSSKHVAQYKNNNKASVYFFDSIEYKGVLLKGTIAICTDPDIKNRLWQDEYKDAYPLGVPADPDYCVLKFTPLSGRFYHFFRSEDFTF